MKLFVIVAIVGAVVMFNGMILGAQTDADAWAAIVVTNGFLAAMLGVGGTVWKRTR